jgi:hypothetical protein
MGTFSGRTIRERVSLFSAFVEHRWILPYFARLPYFAQLPYFALPCETCQSSVHESKTSSSELEDFLNERDTNQLDDYCIIEASGTVGYYLGAAPAVDDELYAIEGAKIPIALRRAEGGKYKVVGHCYLWAPGALDPWDPSVRKSPRNCSAHEPCWKGMTEQYGRGCEPLHSLREHSPDARRVRESRWIELN